MKRGEKKRLTWFARCLSRNDAAHGLLESELLLGLSMQIYCLAWDLSAEAIRSEEGKEMITPLCSLTENVRLIPVGSFL